ncbi:MAG: nitronate monooxygenase [Geodermatophilaceae bacterium]|nr:nitronate monooxygenase [Geodermatophilaceae bacterium]
MRLDRLSVPIVAAPLAGGPSTPELTAAVLEAGAFGFLAAGYKTPLALADDIATLRGLTDKPYGVNLFVPDDEVDAATFSPYLQQLAEEAERHGVVLGEPRYDDDFFTDKIEVVLAERVPVVSFTFGCPDDGIIQRLHDAGSEVWVTVTDPDEAALARSAGADVLVVQGIEAGGHRGCFIDREDREDYGLLALLQLLIERVDLPLVAAGGISTGAGVAAVLSAGAGAAQLGTAFLLCPESGTSAVHRAAMARPGRTRLTRAFTGRLARGIENRFLVEHSAAAPIGYPQIHHATAPLRAAGRTAGDGEVVNLWAGQAYRLATEVPAAEVIAALRREMADALVATTVRARGLVGG